MRLDGRAHAGVEQRGARCERGISQDDREVVEVNFPTMTIETAKKERVDFSMEGGIKPKVGEKVTVNYLITGRGKWVAYKVEKAGKAKKASDNR
jgi:hypothetical protein